MKNKISGVLHFVLLRLCWLFVRTLMATYRIEHAEKNKKIMADVNGAYIFAVWHEFSVTYLFGHAWTKPHSVLASRSKDGDFAAFISQKMGFIPVRGSSKKRNVDKGGKEAMEEMIRNLADGISAGITVDGPKGPRHVCKFGAAKVAQESGRPIIPAIGIGTKYWTFPSWDQFKMPKPFCTIKIIYAEPIWVSPEADLQVVCDDVGKALNQLTVLASPHRSIA